MARPSTDHADDLDWPSDSTDTKLIIKLEQAADALR